jgi:RNA polymerase sigma-70 factor (ECF subfamily)
MTHRRREQRRRETFGDIERLQQFDPSTSQEDHIIQQEVAAALTTVIGALSDEDRSTLGLVAGSALPKVSGSTLRKRRQRALDRLRAVWRKLYGES